jgi:hypothetical protein
LLKLGYIYKGSLSKLLDQTTLLPGFTLGEIILLVDPAFTKRLPLLVGEINKRIQEMEIIESKVRLGELVGLEDLLYKSNDLRIIDVNPLVIKNYSGYLNYYSPAPKVIITIVERGKLTNIRAILDTRVEVSYISLNVVLRFKILITYSTRIAL